MSLSTGTHLGPYEILALIGAGGMGEVYKARDPRLNREVAIKISAEHFSERFEREAQAIAALNHPNICTLHDVGPNYLVMEYIEGEEPQGPLPLDEALRITKQIADALEAAHEKGIVHRDLKPANIKIKPDGAVKVLDFGLAAIAQASTPVSDNPANSPTLTLAATQAGMILGTAGYMSPEQARGKKVDKRADIWAFGVVLHELLTGQRLFKGEDAGETLAAVIKEEPRWDAIPAKAQRLLKSCLEKDPKKRLRDIGDAWRLLEEMPAVQTAPVTPQTNRLPWVVTGAFAIAALALAFVHFRAKPPAAAEAVRFSLSLPDKAGFTSSTGDLAVSPDGRRVLFTAAGTDGVPRIYLRSLDTLESRVLAGTDGVSGVPFWSSDSRMIAFGSGGKLKKIDASGGPPQTVCDSPGLVGGGYFTADNRIVFGTAPGGVFQITAGGGSRVPVTILNKSHQESFHAHPFPLPDGKHFLYVRSTTGSGDIGGIFVGSLDAKPEQQDSNPLLPDQTSPVYAPSSDRATGRLLFVREGTLMAQPFDPRSLKLSGDPIPIAERVASQGRFGVFAVSPNGVLAYRTGADLGRQLAWFDRQGKLIASLSEPGLYSGLALSPDGNRVAAARQAERANPYSVDIWLLDFARGASTRFTFDPAFDGFPVWSPDGSRIAFSSSRSGTFDLYWKASNGTGTDEALLKSAPNKVPYDWSRDGRYLLYAVIDPKTRSDLWLLPLTGDRTPMPFLQTQFNEDQGQFSPDGKWIAYSSDESGQREIYVQPFPASSGGGGRWMVSNGGGAQPRWRRDGKELFYILGDRTVMAADVSASSGFKAGVPKALFEGPFALGTSIALQSAYRWDVAPDGQRFLLNTIPQDSVSTAINVVLNWQAALKR